jgi:hypothetical protein
MKKRCPFKDQPRNTLFLTVACFTRFTVYLEQKKPLADFFTYSIVCQIVICYASIQDFNAFQFFFSVRSPPVHTWQFYLFHLSCTYKTYCTVQCTYMGVNPSLSILWLTDFSPNIYSVYSLCSIFLRRLSRGCVTGFSGRY